MAKFGRGLNREIVAAVNIGDLREPLTTASVRQFVHDRGWKATDNHVLVTLANAASDDHSPTYRKYFYTVGRGLYRVRDEYRGPQWR